jgi:hypothetical protein
VAAGQFGEVGALLTELGAQLAGQVLTADEDLPQVEAVVAPGVGGEVLGDAVAGSRGPGGGQPAGRVPGRPRGRPETGPLAPAR